MTKRIEEEGEYMGDEGSFEPVSPIGGRVVRIAADTGVMILHLIQTSRKFVAGFVPPDYLIEGLLQRRFFYSLTARTGDGKTAVVLLIAACIALGRAIGGRAVEKGKVLYFAGENPTDVKMRWIAMAERMNFDPDTIEVYFVEGAFHFKTIADRIGKEVERLNVEFSLIVVDTSAAYFDGEAENDNQQYGDYARRLRALTKLPGGPTVLALCHPAKNAGTDNLSPRGGGAYLAEVDGNLTCVLNDKVVEVHWHGKFRGPNFEPWHFELVEVTADRLKNQRGEHIVTIMAFALSDREHSKKIAETRSEEEQLLIVMLANEEASIADLGRKCDWLISRGADIGKPQKSKVAAKLEKLKSAGLAKQELHSWLPTREGQDAPLPGATGVAVVPAPQPPVRFGSEESRLMQTLAEIESAQVPVTVDAADGHPLDGFTDDQVKTIQTAIEMKLATLPASFAEAFDRAPQGVTSEVWLAVHKKVAGVLSRSPHLGGQKLFDACFRSFTLEETFAADLWLGEHPEFFG